MTVTPRNTLALEGPLELGISGKKKNLNAASLGSRCERTEVLSSESAKATFAGRDKIALKSTASVIPAASGLPAGRAQGDNSAENRRADVLMRQAVRRNLTTNGSPPASVMTDSIMINFTCSAEECEQSVEQLMHERAEKNPAGLLGNPEEYGAMYVFPCGRHAGYITGQNIPMDGGSFCSSV